MSLFGKSKDAENDARPESRATPRPQAAPAPPAPPAPPARDDRTTFTTHDQGRELGEPSRQGGESVANIGKSITIKGDLSGNEDVHVEGTIEGRVELPDNEITIGPEGQANAEVHAKTVVVIGKVHGNVTAVDRIEVQASGSVDGDVRAPRLIVQEGAQINGSIEMGSVARSGSGGASAAGTGSSGASAAGTGSSGASAAGTGSGGGTGAGSASAGSSPPSTSAGGTGGSAPKASSGSGAA